MQFNKLRIILISVITFWVYVTGAFAQTNPMIGLIQRYDEDLDIMGRNYGLPFWESHQDRWKKFLTDWENAIRATEFDKLDQDARVDYHLLITHLEHERQSLKDEWEEEKSLHFFLPFARSIVNLEADRRKGSPVEAWTIADTLTAITTSITQAKDIIDEQDISIPELRQIHQLSQRLRRILQQWFDFYNGYDPLFTWWVERPYNGAFNTLEVFIKNLDSRIGKPDDEGLQPIVGVPIGRSGLIRELRQALISNTPEQLIELGWKEYQWCENEMLKASEEMGFGQDWLKALNHVKSLYVTPGEQPGLIREMAWEAIRFVEEKQLVTIPSLAKETWRMGMMSPRRQLVNPFFTGGEVISVSFPTNTMQHDQKLMSLRGNNRHFCRATVHHELIPGHHLQGFMTRRYKPYRRVFSTPFWGEGLPLHWEMLFWDLDFPQGPEDRMGMLFWRTHRAARIIFSLSFHLGKMTPQECVDFLIEKVGHEPANAEAEVRRSFEGNYSPLYQCAYLIGGLQIRALYNECIVEGKFTPKSFHDAVLRENSIPLALLRAKLLNEPLSQENPPMWFFPNN